MLIAKYRYSPECRLSICAWLLAVGACWTPLKVDSAEKPVAEAGATTFSTADSTRKYRYLAKTARERKDHDKALRYYDLLLRYDPEYAAAHYFRGKIFVELKDYASAKESLLAGIGLDSLHVNSNALLCRLYLFEGKADSSQAYVNRIRDLNGGRYRSLQRRIADALRRQGLTRDAIAQYANLAAADSSQSVELCDLLATLCRDIGEPAEALSWLRRLLSHQERAVSADPGDRIETLQEMAFLQQQTGAFDDALATLERLAQMDSTNTYPYYSQMAAIAEQTNRPRIEKTALAGMATANPKDVESTAALAELFLIEGELAGAEEWVGRGLAAVPLDAHLQVLKGDIMARHGLEDEAIAAFEIARDDPDWRTVAQQRIWQLRPPETEEERLKRAFFGRPDSVEVAPE